MKSKLQSEIGVGRGINIQFRATEIDRNGLFFCAAFVTGDLPDT